MITRRRQSQSFCLYSYLTGAESSRRKTLPESVSKRTKRGDGERDRCWRGKKRATMVKKPVRPSSAGARGRLRPNHLAAIPFHDDVQRRHSLRSVGR